VSLLVRERDRDQTDVRITRRRHPHMRPRCGGSTAAGNLSIGPRTLLPPDIAARHRKAPVSTPTTNQDGSVLRPSRAGRARAPHEPRQRPGSSAHCDAHAAVVQPSGRHRRQRTSSSWSSHDVRNCSRTRSQRRRRDRARSGGNRSLGARARHLPRADGGGVARLRGATDALRGRVRRLANSASTRAPSTVPRPGWLV
jgi:hypothetical protein